MTFILKLWPNTCDIWVYKSFHQYFVERCEKSKYSELECACLTFPNAMNLIFSEIPTVCMNISRRWNGFTWNVMIHESVPFPSHLMFESKRIVIQTWNGGSNYGRKPKGRDESKCGFESTQFFWRSDREESSSVLCTYYTNTVSLISRLVNLAIWTSGRVINRFSEIVLKCCV